ncbi:TNT domain-containing protein [Actinomadura sp. PM05-2]|uniref:TNT domain-containing protein n=1 Tax=Actinomadura parmotrematis TaxID=2864039 RepID=A0ABS7FM60_9ACTN|nr:TNT domain-containing protein [Actinomadura parmotrematis]
MRRAQYISEQGTWFSATFLVEHGTAQPYYNYDVDPLWDPPPSPDVWTRDQIVLPRDGAHVPEWLRERQAGREPSYPGEGVDEGAEPLDAAQQMEVLTHRLPLLAADQAPPLWRKIVGFYQACGGHVEFPPPLAYLADGGTVDWTPPPAFGLLLDRLRAAQGGAWSRMDFEILYDEGAVRCRASYTRDAGPPWNRPPVAADVRRELERFPRPDPPEWMAAILRRADGTAEGPAPAGPAPRAEGVRRARVFDHVGPDGDDPSVTRPAVPDEEVRKVLDYLWSAPVVLVARSTGPDQMDPGRGDLVPLTVRTDGRWTWTGAVAYYLAEHGVPPEPDLVEHIRANGHTVPEVSEEAMAAAIAAATGRAEPPRLRTDWPARAVQRLADLGVDEAAYSVGATADGAWCLVAEDGRWAVFKQAGGERFKEVVFDAPDDAAAHLVGRCLLTPARRRLIAPLAGEPPATLFRGAREVEVPVGTVVDRHGEPDGNVAYAEHTPFERRSLPPEWKDRPRRAYRLRRPVRAVTGTAVPWFGQPGGGVAYIFARSFNELLHDGSVVETG